MKLCLDEMYAQEIAGRLRAKGLDVVSVHDRENLEGTPDRELLERMAEEHRGLVTDDVHGFVPIVQRLAREGRDHYGLLLTTHATMPRSRNTIGLFVRVLARFLNEHPADDALVNQVVWLRPA